MDEIDIRCTCNPGDRNMECPVGKERGNHPTLLFIDPSKSNAHVALTVERRPFTLESGVRLEIFCVRLDTDGAGWEEAFTTDDQLRCFYRGLEAAFGMIGKQIRLLNIPR